MRRIEWILRRWTDFRAGYATYLVFMVGMSNFVLIAYNFVPWVSETIRLWQFVIIAGAVLIPTALVLGRVHHRTAYKTDRAVWNESDYYRDRIMPDSKEVYEARFREDMARFMEWQAAMALRRFNRSEPDATDQVDALHWMDTMKHWAEKHRQYREGASASKLH